MTDLTSDDTHEVDARDLESPLGALRARMANINDLTQREVDHVLSKLRAKSDPTAV